jgi:hypothetical protein
MSGRRVVNEDLKYRASWGHRTFHIPAGTPVIPASNLPDEGLKRYWVEPWEGMTEEEESWQRNYGFLVTEEEVTQ